MSLLKMRNITKRFPGVVANDCVSLTIEPGEIHSLLGENGAGKTTLMNILYGLYQPDNGEIVWGDKQVRFQSPSDAIDNGIGMVHQHFMLVDNMTVLQNIILGLKTVGYPFINITTIAKEIKELGDRYGLQVDPHKRIRDLSVGQQQRVEILKALYRDAHLLILDEPTAILTPQEISEFFEILLKLRDEGHSIIFITHHLSEIMEISDSVTVLRNGKNVKTVLKNETNINELSRLMMGRDLDELEFKKCKSKLDGQVKEVLDIDRICLCSDGEKLTLDNISLRIQQGEILGIAGIDGNGQKELIEIICGIRKPSNGSIKFGGLDISKLGIRQRFEEGIAYITDDRHVDGLVLGADVKENLMLRCYYTEPYSRYGILNRDNIKEMAKRHISEYNIKTPEIFTKVANLSGGNQQKIILAREISSSARLLVTMQPTRGLDIGATQFVRQQLFNCRDSGRSVLLSSTDLEEIMIMSDRIAVIFEGKIMGVFDNTDEITAEMIGLMMGGKTMQEAIA